MGRREEGTREKGREQGQGVGAEEERREQDERGERGGGGEEERGVEKGERRRKKESLPVGKCAFPLW